jgi:hypothetical protein
MTIPDMFLNTAIGMVTGLASGAFLATRSPGFPTMQHITYHRQINMNNTYVNNYRSETSSEVANYSSSNFALFVIAIIFVTILFAKYRLEILSFGLLLITFCSASVLTFIAISFRRDKHVIWWGIWCIVCLAGIIYIYWIFAHTLNVPTYNNYIHNIKVAGIKAIHFSNAGLFPAYQTIGLIALFSVVAFIFFQSLAILLEPIANQNSIIFHVFHFCNRYNNYYAMIAEACLLIMSFAFVSGRIITWLNLIK